MLTALPSTGARRGTVACLLAACLLTTAAGCGNESGSSADAGRTARNVSTLATGLEVPWGLAFLPDGTALFTERDSARLRQLDTDGTVSDVQTIPGVNPGGEGGLLGVAVSPNYEQDNTVFVYYTAPADNRIARLRLGERPEPIVTGIPSGTIHNGGRLAFGPDGYLYAGTGDSGERSTSQDRESLAGKILRMTTDGKPAPGNPYDSLVYSYGHRNVQGLAWDGAGRMYASEFGQNITDELNRITSGGNYGWPAVEGRGDDERYTNPLVTWDTSEASPSGIAVSGNSVVGNTVAVASLRGERLWLVTLDSDGNAQGEPEAALTGQFGRLRDVVTAPDGSLWVLTSETDGRGSPGDDDDRVIVVPAPGGSSSSDSVDSADTDSGDATPQ